jgi:2-polyprenyl-3-methyl-5-hydroxy-6-metoxy-1,4-benzoquinol methylase
MNTPKEVMLEDVKCPLGCSKNDEIVLTGHDLLHDLPGEFTVVKCRSCGLMRTNPRPTPDTIGFYYPDDYGPYVGTRVQQARPKTASWLKKLLRPIFRRVFNFNTTTLPAMAPGRMLEIGCASGAFLHQMAGKGWQVQGIEFSEKAAQAAAQLGYPVHAGPLETAPQPDEPFDLIVGWMVLEHLHDPIGCLRKLQGWVKPGGYLVLSVPNANSIDFRLFKKYCYANHLPNHLFHFTPHALSNVLQNSGWKLEKVHHQRVLNNLIASTGYVLRDMGYAKLGQKFNDFPKRAGRWIYVLYPLAWLLSVFGQTGRMTIWARVKS